MPILEAVILEDYEIICMISVHSKIFHCLLRLFPLYFFAVHIKIPVRKNKNCRHLHTAVQEYTKIIFDRFDYADQAPDRYRPSPLIKHPSDIESSYNEMILPLLLDFCPSCKYVR